MSKLKKFASMILALVLALGLTTTAFASTSSDDGTGTIIINNAVEGQTYTIYQLADVTYNTGNNAYTYTPTSTWSAFFNTTDAKEYVTVTSQGYLTWNNNRNTDADKAAFAKLAQAYAENNSITSQGSATASANGTVTFSNLTLGWYLADTSLGTLCNLTTTDPSVSIEEKNETTTVDKEVLEDSTSLYNDENTAAIGQTVTFKATLTELKGSTNVVLHDKMAAGLTYVGITSVIVYDKDNTPSQTLSEGTSGYTVSTDSQDYTFELTIAQPVLDTLTDGDYIVVLYTATVNNNAVIAGGGNENTAKVSYSDKNSYSTESKTITYVYSFKLNKTDDDGNALSGATFTLSEGSTAIKFSYNSTTNTYQVAEDQSSSTASSTITAGDITISGLDAGTYTLKETNAPDGYNLLAYDITVTIAENGEVSFRNASTNATLDADSEDTIKINVINVAGATLPTTGGIGTTIFYIVGSVLVLGAIVLLITRKRMSRAE